MKNLLVFLAAAAFFAACQRDNGFVVREDSPIYDGYTDLVDKLDLPPQPYAYQAVENRRFIADGLHFKAVDDNKATLGRVLFYDKSLSADGKIACASCHDQRRGFADSAALSAGIFGRHTLRNVPALNNMVYGGWEDLLNFTVPTEPGGGHFFWDCRATSIAQQSEATFGNEREMGMTMPQVVDQIRGQRFYEYLWKKAFGKFEPMPGEVLDALSNFLNSFDGFHSRFDKGFLELPDTAVFNLDFKSFSGEENRGKKVYNQSCAHCHGTLAAKPGIVLTNNGLDLNYADQGLGAMTQQWGDMGVFKVPSLRNIELTAPYMHDGRFATLEQVVKFYSDDIKKHPNLDWFLTPFNDVGGPRFPLSLQQKHDLVVFLKTLTDKDFCGDPRYSDPFKH